MDLETILSSGPGAGIGDAELACLLLDRAPVAWRRGALHHLYTLGRVDSVPAYLGLGLPVALLDRPGGAGPGAAVYFSLVRQPRSGDRGGFAPHLHCRTDANRHD